MTSIFGNSPRVKLLDFLLDHVDFDYTISQMHEFTGISRPTLYPLTEELERDGMIVLTREVGGSRFFRINLEHPKVAWMLRRQFEGITKAVHAGRMGKSPQRRTARSGRPARARVSSTPSRRATRARRSA